MTDLIYDVVVVGAGVEGSATALTLVGKAQNCTVAILEQVGCSIHYLFTNIISRGRPVVSRGQTTIFTGRLYCKR